MLLLIALLVPATSRFALVGPPMTRWLPLALIVAIVMQFTGLQVVQSTLGVPIDRTWTSAYKDDPALQKAVRVNLARGDPQGASEFLQQQMAKDGPFRYAGYAGLDAPHSALKWSHYPDGRLNPEITAILANTRPMRLDLYRHSGLQSVAVQGV